MPDYVMCKCGERSKSLAKRKPCLTCGATYEQVVELRKSICTFCGEEYQAVRLGTVACANPKCKKKLRAVHRAKHNEGRRKVKEKLNKVCPVCKKNFATWRPDRINCSPECSHIWHKVINRSGTMSVSRALLGPEEAPQPTHVCVGYPAHNGKPAYKCSVKTADRRCPKCRAMMRAIHGVVGSYDPSMNYCGGNGMDQVRI